jgi:RNA polymerase-binding transcription factor DksA
MNQISDASLRAARKWLLTRSAELRARVKRTQDDLGRAVDPLPRDAPDAAIAVENDEILQAIGETARAELNHIAHALERLDAGTFGKCEQCGESIESERLRVVPYTTQCRACAKDA